MHPSRHVQRRQDPLGYCPRYRRLHERTPRLFAHVPNLIIELKETMSNNQMSNYRKRFEKYDLVILDELGYISMDKTGCEMIFNLISSWNEKGSIIATSNLTFDRWEEVFKDPTLTGALIDHLAHKARVLDNSREKAADSRN